MDMAMNPATSPESLISSTEKDPRSSMVYVVAALAVLAPQLRTKPISSARHPTTVAAPAAIILGWVAIVSGAIDRFRFINSPSCPTGRDLRTLPPRASDSPTYPASSGDTTGKHSPESSHM